MYFIVYFVQKISTRMLLIIFAVFSEIILVVNECCTAAVGVGFSRLLMYLYLEPRLLIRLSVVELIIEGR